MSRRKRMARRGGGAPHHPQVNPNQERTPAPPPVALPTVSMHSVNVTPDEAPSFASSPYVEDAGRIWWRRVTRDGSVASPLCNFTAAIQEEVVEDDGAERHTYFLIQGRLASGAPLEQVRVPSAQFGNLGWVTAQWGARAVVNAGMGTKDHLRAALQELSGAPSRRVVFAHTGWRLIEGRWVYLHGGGAIGAEGSLLGIEVNPGERLQSVQLPDPPEGASLQEAIRASLEFLEVAPDAVSVPLFLAAYRAPLGPSPFALHLAGRSGNGKSVLQGILQAHWGSKFDYEHLPANWQSTKTALEVLTFTAKDAVLCIDDFAPDGSKQDQARLQGTLAHIFRSVGNGASRDRCTDSANLRASRPPRGLVVSSGEDIPSGLSVQARILVLETEPRMIRWARVTELQLHARTGKLAAAMAGYLRWLAPQMDTLTGALAERQAILRHDFPAAHRRTTDQAAHLFAGGECFLRFAQEVGALQPEEAAALRLRFQSALGAAAEAQAESQSGADPVHRALDGLRAIFLSGRAHLEGTQALVPPHAGRLGWVKETGDFGGGGWTPKGRCIGYEDAANGLLYLEPGACFAELQAQSSQEGEPLPVSKGTLWKRFRERGLIERESADRLMKKAPGRGRLQRCVALRAQALWNDEGEADGVIGEVV